MTTPVVFPPVRGEPFFENTPELDVSKLRISVRWQSYLDQLGTNSNTSDNNLESEISGIESEIQAVQAFTAELAKRDDELISIAGKLESKVAELNKRDDELNELIDSNSRLESKIAELTKKLDCLSQLVE
jgi:ABC-type transporter Mla subunit MlaD